MGASTHLGMVKVAQWAIAAFTVLTLDGIYPPPAPALPADISEPAAVPVPPKLPPKGTPTSGSGGGSFLHPRPPSRNAPGSSRGAGNRGVSTCLTPTKNSENPVLNKLIALVPTDGRAESTWKNTIWGRTLAERPSFQVYVPYTDTAIDSMEFILQDEQDEDVYRTRLTIPQAVGIIRVQLPATVAPLQPGKFYHWYLNVAQSACPLESKYVEGWVERVTPEADIVSRLQQASPQQRAVLYAENGIWYDALSTLAELRLVNPKDVSVDEIWHNLLKSVNLGDLVSQPLLNCCVVKEVENE